MFALKAAPGRIGKEVIFHLAHIGPCRIRFELI